MSKSTMTINIFGNKIWRNENGKYHRLDGPAIELTCGTKEWYINGEFIGRNDKGFWDLWDRLIPEQRQNSNLLEYLPENFSV